MVRAKSVYWGCTSVAAVALVSSLCFFAKTFVRGPITIAARAAAVAGVGICTRGVSATVKIPAKASLCPAKTSCPTAAAKMESGFVARVLSSKYWVICAESASR